MPDVVDCDWLALRPKHERQLQGALPDYKIDLVRAIRGRNSETISELKYLATILGAIHNQLTIANVRILTSYRASKSIENVCKALFERISAYVQATLVCHLQQSK
jgi:hypothetical protein